MDHLNKYNEEKFVNREQPLAMIQEKLQSISTSNKSTCLHFWGMGGRGKTSLKRQINTIYKHNQQSASSNYVIIDWDGDTFLNKSYSMPEILINFRNEFARQGFKMHRFTKFITFYRKVSSAVLPDIIDETEESVTQSIFKGLFDFISQSTTFGAAIEGILDITQASSRRKKSKQLKKEYEMFSNLDARTMSAILLKSFFEDVQEEMNDRQLIFIIDTFEDIRIINMDFLFAKQTEFNRLPGLFYALQPSLWIVFGRDKVHLTEEQTSFQLENFNIEETLIYMKENLQKIPETKGDHIYTYSKGWPLLLSELRYHLSWNNENITPDFFEQLTESSTAKQAIKTRYEKYFSKNFNDEQQINLLKILFAFRQWTIPKDNIASSDLYRFTKTYYGNVLQTIDIESKLRQLFQLSFIKILSRTKHETIYEIDPSIYTALVNETIDHEPVLPLTLKKNMMTFIIQDLANEEQEISKEAVRVEKHQAKAIHMIDLLYSYDEQKNPIELYQEVRQLIEDNHIHQSTAAFIQIVLLEKFSKQHLSTKEGERILDQIINYLRINKIIEYVDRIVYLLKDVQLSQILNEKIANYLLSIGQLSYAKMYFEKAIPKLERIQKSYIFIAFEDDNFYNSPASLRLDLKPEQLIEGFELAKDTMKDDSVDYNMQLYRKFLDNLRKLIRVKIELGDLTHLLHLLRVYDITIHYDQERKDENILHSLWLYMDFLMLRNMLWDPSIVQKFKDNFIHELKQNKQFVLDHPSFLISIHQFSNSLFRYGYLQLQQTLHDYAIDLMFLVAYHQPSDPDEFTAYSKVIKSDSFKQCMLYKSMLIYPNLVEGSESRRKEIEQDVLNYYKTRVDENWQLPMKRRDLIETGKFDLKVIKFLKLQEDYLLVLSTIIKQLKEMEPNSFHLAHFYYEKGVYLLQEGQTRRSHPYLQKARQILLDHLGEAVETSKFFIPYETYELFNRYLLLKNNEITMTEEEWKIFKERVELNEKMIMNYFNDDLPHATNYYFMKVYIGEGLESYEFEEEYKAKTSEVKELLRSVNEQQFQRMIQALGRHLFLDHTGKYNYEYSILQDKHSKAFAEKQTQDIVQGAKKDWDDNKLPTSHYDIYYRISSHDLSYLINNNNDFDTFFNLYFRRLQELFKLSHQEAGQAGTKFEELTDTIIDIQFANYKHRNRILKTLADALQKS